MIIFSVEFSLKPEYGDFYTKDQQVIWSTDENILRQS